MSDRIESMIWHRALVGALIASAAINCAAQTASVSKEGWNGTVGFGPMFLPQYTGGSKTQTLPLPLLSINYSETFYVEVQRVGIYVLASDDKKIGLGLAMEPRLGFSASDGPRLAGMATRRNSLEAGFTFDWDFDVVAFSAAWLTDATHSSRGSSTRLSIYAPVIKNSRGEIGIIASADRMSAKTADYFFAVRGNEVTLSRPRFAAGAGTSTSIGIGGTYRLGGAAQKGLGAVIFGANVGKLPSSVARSPIVETDRTSQVYVGYGWSL